MGNSLEKTLDRTDNQDSKKIKKMLWRIEKLKEELARANERNNVMVEKLNEVVAALNYNSEMQIAKEDFEKRLRGDTNPNENSDNKIVLIKTLKFTKNNSGCSDCSSSDCSSSDSDSSCCDCR